MQRKKVVMVFCIYQRALKGFHRLMVNAEEYKKSNLKKITHTLPFIVLKWLIACQALFIREISSRHSVYFIDLSNWSLPFYRC